MRWNDLSEKPRFCAGCVPMALMVLLLVSSSAACGGCKGQVSLPAWAPTRESPVDPGIVEAIFRCEPSPVVCSARVTDFFLTTVEKTGEVTLLRQTSPRKWIRGDGTEHDMLPLRAVTALIKGEREASLLHVQIQVESGRALARTTGRLLVAGSSRMQECAPSEATFSLRNVDGSWLCAAKHGQ
jgi:hypothetical protein